MTKIATMPLTSLGAAAAAVVDKLRPAPPGIEVLYPSSREEWLHLRRSTIGASEASALLGANPFVTPYELFMLKSGRIEKPRDEITVNENSIHLPPMERGNFLEERAFELTRMLRPNWTVEPNQIPGGVFFVDSEAGLSTTPDAFLTAPDRQGRGSLQTKTVAPLIFSKEWKQDGEVELPLYVAVQAIQDASLSGCEWACAGAMVTNFGIDYHLMDVPLHAKLMTKIREKAAEFWDRIKRDDPYDPDYGRDGKIIAQVYADDDGSQIDLTGERIVEIITQREALKAREADGSAAEKERKVIDAEIISMLGNATRGRLPDGRMVEAKTINRKEYVAKASSYRAVKVKG